MVGKLVIANLKAELNDIEIKIWLKSFISILKGTVPFKNKIQILVCPPVVFLDLFKRVVKKSSSVIKIGVQTISSFDQGNYTGEVTASMLKNLAEYVLIGHSEERRIKEETQSTIQRKIDLANQSGLKVILCLEKEEKYHGQIYALAYEPTAAIGTGKAQSAQESYAQMQAFKQNFQAQYYLYGGSVNSDNVNEFIQAGFTGVLVGKKSLDPEELMKIVEHI